MPRSGIAFKTIILANRTDIPVFKDADLTTFLDMCAGFMNVDFAKPVEPSDKQAQWRIMQSPVYKQTRARLQVLLDQVAPRVGVPLPSAPMSAMDDSEEEC